MRRALRALLAPLILLLVLSPSVAASESGVVVSEFRFRGPDGGNDEFIELLNSSNNAVDISGWTLQGCAASSGNPSNRGAVPSGTTLEPGDHYLFTNSSGYSGTVDGDTNYSTGVSDSGGARVVDVEGSVVDGVASSDGAEDQCREGTGLDLPTSNGDNAFERRNDGTQDTNDNAADFQGPKDSDPQNLGGGTNEAEITPIHDIQGAGESSPIEGQTVTVKGVVTGIDDEIGASFTRFFPEDAGIFVQEEQSEADDDPETSEGIFVGFVRNRGDYPPGTVVRLEGQVREKFGFTIIAEERDQEPEIVGEAPVPEPVEIVPARAEIQDPETRAYYETLEGMRVRLAAGTANSGGTNKFGELFLTPGEERDRVFRTEEAPALIATDADAGAGDPNNPLRDPDGSTTEVEADLFDRVEGLVGPLAFSFDNFKVMVQPGLLPEVIDGPRDYPYDELEPAGEKELRIASFNFENFFSPGSDLDQGTVGEEEYAEKKARLADAVDRLLERPGILAVQEVENREILQDLATDLGGYTAYLEEGNDERGIDVGFLIQDDVRVIDVTQYGKNAQAPEGLDCSDVDGRLFDRPPLAMEVQAQGFGEFAVISNHFASKSAPDACREAQAAFVRDLVAELEEEGERAIVTGDLNAFEDEGALEILQDGETTLDNLWDEAPEEERYSFQFGGKLQTLDHMLLTRGLQNKVCDFRYAHFDNDYYKRDDPTDGHKVSDHDPPVLTLSRGSRK